MRESDSSGRPWGQGRGAPGDQAQRAPSFHRREPSGLEGATHEVPTAGATDILAMAASHHLPLGQIFIPCL